LRFVFPALNALVTPCRGGYRPATFLAAQGTAWADACRGDSRKALKAVSTKSLSTEQSCRRTLRVWACAAALLLAADSGCRVVSSNQNAQGVRMFDQAYYQGAQQRFAESIQTDPSNPEGYYNLARTYHQLGKLHSQPSDFQQAESYYHQCLDRDPNNQDCYRGLAVLLVEQNRSADAFKLVEGWSARSPSLPAPKIELARLYEESGNRDAAKQQLIAAVAVDPSNARALAALGKLREETGDTAQALANYQRSLAVDPNQPQVATRIAALSIPPAGTIVTPPGGTRVVTAPASPTIAPPR
jgi:tetratricopeptide (TPR) repeat protein